MPILRWSGRDLRRLDQSGCARDTCRRAREEMPRVLHDLLMIRRSFGDSFPGKEEVEVKPCDADDENQAHDG